MTNFRVPLRVLWIAVLLALAPQLAAAQFDTATVLGMVTDPSRA